MLFLYKAATLAAALLVSGAALAQLAGGVVDPAALAAARDVVSKAQGDRAAVLQSMSAPMAGLVAQLGVREPDRAQVLVNEVILPTLSSRYDELIDLQARSYATVLSVGDLQAISAFYSTPAGRNLATAQPKIAQAQVAGMTQWMTAVAPDLQAKLTSAIQNHGWNAPARR